MSNTAFALLLSLMLALNVSGHRGQSKRSAGAADLSTRSSTAFEGDESKVLIRGGWVQEGPPSQTITAAYMTIENQTGADISLRSASTEVAQTIELHKMELLDGIMKMHRVEAIDIPAGGKAELKPGGYHLMVIGLKKELKEGDKVTIALEFSNGLRKTITIPVKPRSALDNPANDFALTDQNNKPFHLSQLRGKLVFLFFGYTHCPDACPTTMAKLSQVNKLLAHDAQQVETVFISVDPGRDTTSVLKSYLAYFHMNSIGLTGTKQEIDVVVEQYGAKYEIEQSDSAAGYHIDHSTDLYLLNQTGELTRKFSYSDGTQVIVEGVRSLIRQ